MKIIKGIILGLVLISGLNSCQTDEGDNLTEPRDKFTGTWLCEETPKNNPANKTSFSLTIDKKGSKDTVLIKNFNNLGFATTTIGLVSNSSIQIPNQTVDGIIISGTGNYSNSLVNLNYLVDDGQSAPVEFNSKLSQ
jgi:hypothetical protein